MLERTVKTTDALGNETNTTYDAMGRVSTVSGKIDGGDSVTAYTYDGNGNVIKESVTSNKPGETTAYRNTYYQYDSMNRLIKTNTDEPGETLYEYDDNGNVTKMTTGAVNGAGGVSTTYEYDSQNRLVKTTDPMGYTETYTYDNNGNVASMTDKNGTVTTNTYNAVNNLLNSASVKDTTTQTTTYTYGAASGVLLGISDDNSSISYSYNKKGQQTGESRSTGETLTYTYDKDGNQTGMTMSANNGGISQNLSYTYNYLGQMTEVKDNAANEVIAAYTYDGNGNITEKKTNGNSMITEYTYNESGLIKTVENQTVADPLRNIKGTYSKYSYNYYLDGNQSDMTDVFNKTKAYTYDGAGRLKTETYVVADGDTIETTYEYDERGNRLSKEQLAQQDDPYGISLMEYDPRPQYGYGEGETVYTYDANNRMITSKYNYDNYMNEDHTYTYDNNGNLKSDYSIVFYDDFAPADGTHIVYHEGTENYTYDNLNRLKRYSGEIYADYAYDPTGMRISKKLENENQINYVWSGGNIIGEYGIDGSKTYLRGAGGEIVKTKDGNSEERYFAYNGHGDTTSIVEKAPESVSFGVTATYEYDAFGNLIEGSETGETHENSFRYNGQQVDEESGLIYLRNRYYNPEIGRFITEDPYWHVNNMIYGEDGNNGVPSYASIVQSANLYVYCMSEPVNFADPSGCNIITYIQQAYLMYGVTAEIARGIWRLGAEFYLNRYKGWYLTATLLELSVNGSNNQSFVANGGDYAAEAIRNNSGFNNEINNRIWNYANVGETSVDFWGSYDFNLNGDLGAALHNVYYHVKGNKNSEGRWDVYVSVYDTFDFTEFIIPIGGEYTAQETFLWIINDAAAISQAVKVIKPVSVEINYRQLY